MVYFWGALGVVAWILIAFWPAWWAQKKGYNFFLFLALSWFISFVLTLLVILFLRDKTETPQSRATSDAVDKIMADEMKR